MTTERTEITWAWDGEAVRVGVDRAGTGPALLLLPALSSISTRREMRPLQEPLASSPLVATAVGGLASAAEPA